VLMADQARRAARSRHAGAARGTEGHLSAQFTQRSGLSTTSVVDGLEVGMRDYLVTIATATLAAWLLQYGGPPACANGLVPVPASASR
jgi:hypothetical protein